MGGFAAKQRRRLERQSLQPPAEQTIAKSAPTGDSRKVAVQRAPVKKKIQKPKHLKRKLEAIETGGLSLSETEQDRLRRQMEEFKLIKERQKKLKVAEEKSDERKTPVVSNNSNKKSRESNPTNTDKPKQGKQKYLPPKGEIEPSTSSKDADSELTVRVKPSNSDNHVDDSDDEVDLNLNASRQRGKRRRGRKDLPSTSTGVGDVETVVDKVEDSVISKKSDEMKSRSDDSPEGVIGSSRESSSHDAKSPDKSPIEDSAKVRRCIGRKPVTDFKIGQCYSGKVVYAKPFGVFFDIGCHSDAFCHVSQLSDKFIESPVESFPVGQIVDNIIRVVAIDRRKKRLTVSLQSPSNNKISEEFEKRKEEAASASHDEALPGQDSQARTVISASSENVSNLYASSESKISSSVHRDLHSELAKSEESNTKEMTAAEQLKRARKIARRAQRRAVQ